MSIESYIDLRGSDRLDYFTKKVREVAKFLEEGHYLSLIDTKTWKVLKRFVKKGGVVNEILECLRGGLNPTGESSARKSPAKIDSHI